MRESLCANAKKILHRLRFRWLFLFAVLVLLCLALILEHPLLENMTLVALVAVTAMYVVFTYEQAEASKKMVEEMMLERKTRLAPSIAIYFDNPVSNLFELVVRNTGEAAVRNVRLRISPPLMDFRNRDIGELSLFREGVAFFPPGREFRQAVDTGVKYFEEDSR